ncbi:hypothetical protein NC652_010701 [Populus alba x Populus x berolinensis]|nr:hypothetical protein NC652_010701 [Populus alba x Populus x berolinensis]
MPFQFQLSNHLGNSTRKIYPFGDPCGAVDNQVVRQLQAHSCLWDWDFVSAWVASLSAHAVAYLL